MNWPELRNHPFLAGDVIATQCLVPGCWGWVDDPRHLTSDRREPRYPQVVVGPARPAGGKRGPLRPAGRPNRKR